MTQIKAIAHLNELTKDVKNDYYLRPEVRGTFYTKDIIKRMSSKEIATLNVNGEAFVSLFLNECIQAVFEGYNVVTNLFRASIGIEGVILSNQLGHTIPADELLVRMNLSQGAAARDLISTLSVSVGEQAAATGPVIQNVMNPAKNEPDSLNTGKMVLIQGMRLAVRGDKTDEIGVFFTSEDGATTIRVAPDELSPNTPTKLQFAFPAELTPGEWRVKVATQATGSSTTFTKEIRTFEYPNIISIV